MRESFRSLCRKNAARRPLILEIPKGPTLLLALKQVDLSSISTKTFQQISKHTNNLKKTYKLLVYDKFQKQ